MRAGSSDDTSRAALDISRPIPNSTASTFAVPPGRIASGSVEPHHAVRDLIDGAVAPGGEDHVRAFVNAFSSDAGSDAGSSRGNCGHRVTLILNASMVRWRRLSRLRLSLPAFGLYIRKAFW